MGEEKRTQKAEGERQKEDAKKRKKESGMPREYARATKQGRITSTLSPETGQAQMVDKAVEIGCTGWNAFWWHGQRRAKGQR